MRRLLLSALAATGAAGLVLTISPDAEAGRSGRHAARVELGRRLFMDPTVSRGGRFSCAACHDPEHGFSDARVLSEDENGATARHSQTLLDLRDGTGMHWDGEFDRVRELLVARLAPIPDVLAQTRELNRQHFRESRGRDPDPEAFRRKMESLRPPYYGPDTGGIVTLAAPLVRRLEEDGRYAEGFRLAFGSATVTTEYLIDALEAYVTSLRSGRNAYDRYAAGERDALTPAARRGLALFTGRAHCAQCHALDHAKARFTDDRFHNTGVAYAGATSPDAGRLGISFVPADVGRFKTPTLRDVARRAPYMHDGSLATLEDVVRYYKKGGTPNPGLDPHVRPLDLGEGDVADLVAFLRALTSGERPGIGPVPRHRPAFTRIRVVGLKGEPVAGQAVRVVPCGDRLADATTAEADTLTCRTDRDGWIRFRFPGWTHVRLEGDGFSVGEPQPLPDYLREAELLATPRDLVSVRVLVPDDVALPPVIRATAQAERSQVLFRRIRALSPREALYVADGRQALAGRVRVMLDLTSRRTPPRPHEIDFAGGASTALDLRPDPDLGPPAPGVPPAPASGRETLAVARTGARAERR